MHFLQLFLLLPLSLFFLKYMAHPFELLTFSLFFLLATLLKTPAQIGALSLFLLFTSPSPFLFPLLGLGAASFTQLFRFL